MIKCLQCPLQRTLARMTVFRNFRTCVQLNIEKQQGKGTQDSVPVADIRDQINFPAVPDEYKRVFHFSYIRHFALINKLKIYQTGITGITASGALILNQLDYISSDALDIVVYLGFASCIPLYGLGFLTGNFIGFIYYNEHTNMARIAYTDYWGRRKDLELPVNDIIPLQDLPDTPWRSLWMTFRRYSTKHALKINTKFAVFVDKKALKKIL